MAPLPSELAILSEFLLGPAQLPAAISLADFAALFPKSLQNAPQVRALYRDLQRERNAVVDDVAAEIEDEVARGRQLRRYAVSARLRADAQEDAAGDDELQIERFMSWRADDDGGSGGAPRHSLASIVAELEASARDLEADVQQLESEEARLLASLQQTTGDLSDLRYGRLANPQLREQVLEGLANVQETCTRTQAPDALGSTT